MDKLEKIKMLKTERETWTPKYGEELDKLLTRVFQDDDDAKNKVRQETLHIMQLCGDPSSSENQDTGLVFGYVQSGKTLSFTALTAMANDNNYRMVIILAGISRNLVKQSFNRLNKDLAINNEFYRKWVILKNPRDPLKNPQDRDTLSSELSSWSSDSINDKKTILITVMKNTHHLRNLLSVLQNLDLEGVPTLIIDDEGDQASLNTKASANAKQKKNNQLTAEKLSTIYRRIRDLKAILPHHTFIQYTATPQAPLFINILDILSPNFIQLLTPGEKYTGGDAFFVENKHLVKCIPYSEVYNENNTIETIPKSLKEALKIFFLSVTHGHLLGKTPGNPKYRTMMIHPSRLVDEHGIYYEWVQLLKSEWAEMLDREDHNESKIQLITEFQKAYQDLQSTVHDLKPFDELLETLGKRIQKTAIQQLNSKKGSTVNWNNNYSYILVGGQAMDRGFTVEGLTITYMPRSKGVGNADTIQQRARFFGYKRDYIGHCRVYLDAENIHLFTEYVNHERDVRKKLEEHKLSGEHINEMGRRFVLDEMFKLTRSNVLSEKLDHKSFGNKWFTLKAPHDHNDMIENNRNVFNEFQNSYKHLFSEDEGHDERTPDQKHWVVTLPLKEIFDTFLNKLKFTRQTDSIGYTNIKSIIDLYTDELPPEDAYIYIMGKDKSRTRRLLKKKDEIQQLYQGKNPKSGKVIYHGDKQIKREDHISIQIHKLNIKDTSYRDVITIAIWIPARLSQTLISKHNAKPQESI